MKCIALIEIPDQTIKAFDQPADKSLEWVLHRFDKGMRVLDFSFVGSQVEEIPTVKPSYEEVMAHLANSLNHFTHVNYPRLDDTGRRLWDRISLGMKRVSEALAKVPERRLSNNLFWFKSERSSFRSVAQRTDEGNYWVIGEAVAISIEELNARGWELDEPAA